MPVGFSGRRAAARRATYRMVFLLPIVGGLVAFSVAGRAQTLPSLQDLRQQAPAVQPVEQGAPMELRPAMSVGRLRPSRLEQILSARAGTPLQQVGYDQLGVGRSVTVPQTGAVQDDYILGSGDTIVVSLRGQENGFFNVTVDRNGQAVLPRLPPIPATGRTFGSFRDDLDAAVRRAYVGTNASVSIGRVRQISVLVSGEVNAPGERLLTGLSSTVDAVLLSGGIKKTGSLRNIRIVRGGHEYIVDLYNVLTEHGENSAMRLADGDRILVPPLGQTVAVTGLVRKPGIYELPSRASSLTARALLALAGGQEVRGRYRLSLMHILPDGRSEMAELASESAPVRDSEILFVQFAADQISGQATLAGGTGLAGAYPVVTGTRLSAVLKAPGALGASPYTPFGLIVRKDPVTLMRSLVPFTPVAVLVGHEDQVLQSDDLIRVFSVNESHLLEYVVHAYLQALATDQTAIRNPLGQRDEAQNSVAREVSRQGGQGAEIDDISGVPSDVQRREIIALLEAPAPGSKLALRQANERLRAEQQQIRAQQQSPTGQQGQTTGSQAQPAQQAQAGQQAQGIQQSEVEQQDTQGQGQVQQIGNDVAAGSAFRAPLPSEGDDFQSRSANAASGPDGLGTDMAANFSQQTVNADRYASNREVQNFGQLAQQLGMDPLVLVNFLIDHRVRLNGAVHGPGYYFIGPNVSLDDLVQAAGGTVNWADESGVELISTFIDRQSGHAITQRSTLPLRQGLLASYIVRPRDQFRFSQIFSDLGKGSVTVQGEVRYAGTFPILRGEHLSELLARAGGLTSTAYPNGTVFLRQSAAQVEHDGYIRAANEVQNQLVIAMTRIGNDKIDPQTFVSMQTFVNELRNQRALGRISVVADPSVLAANPALDPLLEEGDVIYVPQRPSAISVLGQVLQPGSYPYRAGASVGDYLDRAGGYATTADESQTFIVLPDGSARRLDRSWLSFKVENLPPGSAIVVPRDVTPLDLRQTIIDVSQIFSQFAVAIASVAVLSKQ